MIDVRKEIKPAQTVVPQVSIVIPTYKHRDFVLATLESVFAQTFTDYEVIVVNDGSPDDTADLLRPLAAAGRIRYIEQPNQGQSVARNRGITEARGEFIALLDDDDLWPSDKLEWQVSALRSQPEAVLVYGYSEIFGGKPTAPLPGKEGYSGEVQAAFLQQNQITSPGQTLIRANTLKAVGGFDPQLWGIDDWDLYIRLAETGPFIFCARPALRYRLHAANASKNLWRMYTNEILLREKHQDRFRVHDIDVGLNTLPGFYANLCIDIAQREKRGGGLRNCYKMFWLAVRISPSATLHRGLRRSRNFLCHKSA